MKIKNLPSVYFLLTSLVLPIIVIASYLLFQNHFQKLPVLGPYTSERGNEQLTVTPSWDLIDQNNLLFSSKQLENDIQVLNFFFTSCPTVCPAMNRNVQKVQQVYINTPKVQFVSISVDPERDTPKELKKYEESFSLNKNQWHFLTGNKDSIYLMARKGYNLSATDADGGSQNILQSQHVLLIDHQQHIRGIYDGTEPKEIANLVKDITKLQKEINRSL